MTSQLCLNLCITVTVQVRQHCYQYIVPTLFYTQDRRVAHAEEEVATAMVELEMLKEELENVREEKAVSTSIVKAVSC